VSDLSALLENTGELTWLNDIACVDLPPESFFVKGGCTIHPDVLDVCRRCPVRIQCCAHLYNSQPPIAAGYFAGISPGQRKKLSYEEALEFIANDPYKPSSRRRRRRKIDVVVEDVETDDVD
jgi:hypothetical protein